MSDDLIERLGDFWPDNPADRKLIADSMREIEKLRSERDEAKSKTLKLWAAMCELLLDTREFMRWFDDSLFVAQPSPPDHPWHIISDQLHAHANTLAACDAVMERLDKDGAS